MSALETIEKLFGHYVSRNERNLIKRCKELGWNDDEWENIKKKKWVFPIYGKVGDKAFFTGHYQRESLDKLIKYEQGTGN